MEKKDLEELVKKAFPNKLFHTETQKNENDGTNTFQIEVCLGFCSSRYVFYDFSDKALVFSIGNKISYRHDSEAYFKTQDSEVIDDEEFLIKILRHPECFKL